MMRWAFSSRWLNFGGDLFERDSDEVEVELIRNGDGSFALAGGEERCGEDCCGGCEDLTLGFRPAR